MKRLIAIAVLLALAGCATDKSIFQGGTSLTAPIQNPVTLNDWATIEIAYAGSVRLALTYRRLPLCKAGQTETLTNLCARRTVLLAIQDANAKARAALLPFRGFMRNNQTLSALTAIGAVRQAVSDFQNVLATNGVH